MSVVEETKGKARLRPDNEVTESTVVDKSVKGIANNKARKVPAVAIATVRHASRATSSRNSGLKAGGKNSARKRVVTFRFSVSKNTQGRNSVLTSAGQRITHATTNQNTLRDQAGSRRAGLLIIKDSTEVDGLFIAQ